jgi:hypothetical protein
MMTIDAKSTPTAIMEHAAAATLKETTRFGGNPLDDERRLSTSKLFASWAGEDFHSWQQAVGAAVTHLSRGTGHVINVSQEAGVVSVNVRYLRADRSHPLWEFRTELTTMTLPNGLTRDDLIPTVKARRLLKEQEKRAERVAFPSIRHRWQRSAPSAR